MDREIRKVKQKNDKEMDKLIKKDLPRDAKIERCDKMMHKKKK